MNSVTQHFEIKLMGQSFHILSCYTSVAHQVIFVYIHFCVTILNISNSQCDFQVLAN